MLARRISMKKMAILLVGLLLCSAFLVAGNTGKIEKWRVGIKSGGCKNVIYVNPNSIAAINTRRYIDTDLGKLLIDPKTKALYDESGTMVATRLSNSEYIPAGFDKNLDGMLRGEEAVAYSRYKFSQYSGGDDVYPSKSLWDAYLKANKLWSPAGIDNPATPRDESVDKGRLSQMESERAYFAIGIAMLAVAGAFALWLWWRR